ncbi:hypothetical protein DCAR_0313212 [Daucus carota subsp. sativus]|uniref:Uncharacterized protein n=1 Tax=Daucus carota subsp. sativus TaxID=79200 RepID=A0A166BVW6_DAUCS|nr:PREDICTED: F-box/kelch-repeat protein At3g06240-like [Daucus carota subsp. sativus]WOG93924.1 hypothetical protein DCAR_0313212 [Daucus carota subsp. sativus]
MENLPVEITTNIFLRLPARSLGQLQCVSKTLKTLISSPYFTKTHHAQTPPALRRLKLLFCTSSLHTLDIFNEQIQRNPRPHYLRLRSSHVRNYCGAVELVGSCNGLVCLLYASNRYSLVNPTTRAMRVLPDAGMLPARIRLSGFGYVARRDDYRVVCVGSDEVMRVFSAKDGSWRRVWALVPLPVNRGIKPVFVGGVVHWLGFDSGASPLHKVMGFDFVDEEVKMLPLCEQMSKRVITALGVLGGRLCVLSVADHDRDLDLWVMMEYGVRESWMRLCELPIVYPHSPFASVSPISYVGYEILFLADSRCLMLSDIGGGTHKTLEVELQGRGSTEEMQVAVYEETLVSPHDFICQE